MMNANVALIPAYCPGRQLVDLVCALKNNGLECVVVNDGSPPEYDEIFMEAAKNAVILVHSENKGKGAALKTGMKYIQETYQDCVAVTVDADGQHLPEDVLNVVNSARTGEAALVLGVRLFNMDTVPLRSYLGNRITETVFRMMTGVHVSDTQTGLRAFQSSLIDRLLDVPGERYEYEMNQLLCCVKEGLPIREIGITTVYENNNACSHFHPLRDSFLIYKQIFSFGLSSFSSFLVDLLAFAVLSLFLTGSTGVLFANVIARIFSAAFNYEVNRKLVFHDDSSRKESAWKYASLAVMILLANTAVLYVLTSFLHIPTLAAKVITEGILFLVSWTVQNRYIFGNMKIRQDGDQNMKPNNTYRPMFRWVDCLLIAGLTVYSLLDTFVLTEAYQTVPAHAAVETASETEETAASKRTGGTSPFVHASRKSSKRSGSVSIGKSSSNTEESSTKASAFTGDLSYADDNINIAISEYTYQNSQIYVADVQLSSLDYLYTAFADNVYGKNITAKTSETAAANNAILAINGDYYGARNSGYVLRNGVLYRESAQSASQEDLVIHSDGSFSVITEGSASASSLAASDALQVFSFGPALIIDGEIAVSTTEEVGKAKASNPRTAICEIEPLHYLLVVSDGRTDESEGLSLYELASFLQENFDIQTAYNLDGGGSSTMVFNGMLVNNPTTSGSSISERSVSDVICIGY